MGGWRQPIVGSFGIEPHNQPDEDGSERNRMMVVIVGSRTRCAIGSKEAGKVQREELTSTSPEVLLIDSKNGSGHGVNLPVTLRRVLDQPGVDGPKISREGRVSFNSEITGYSWDDVTGVVESAYKLWPSTTSDLSECRWSPDPAIVTPAAGHPKSAKSGSKREDQPLRVPEPPLFQCETNLGLVYKMGRFAADSRGFWVSAEVKTNQTNRGI